MKNNFEKSLPARNIDKYIQPESFIANDKFEKELIMFVNDKNRTDIFQILSSINSSNRDHTKDNHKRFFEKKINILSQKIDNLEKLYNYYNSAEFKEYLNAKKCFFEKKYETNKQILLDEFPDLTSLNQKLDSKEYDNRKKELNIWSLSGIIDRIDNYLSWPKFKENIENEIEEIKAKIN